MKLNLDIISDRLPDFYQKKRFGSQDKSLALGRPSLYEQGSKLKEDRFYVARTQTLPQELPPKGSAFICVGGQLSLEWVASGNQILAISNAQSLFSVFTEIHEIYDQFDEWDAQMRDELENDIDFDIRHLIASATRMLENPIGVCDHSLQNIFYSEIVPGEDEHFSITVGNHIRQKSVEHEELVKDACQLERLITVPYMTTASSPTLSPKSYCNNLYLMGHFSGCVYISAHHRIFRDSDIPIADHFFGYFQKAYFKYLRSFNWREQPQTMALQNLLNYNPLTPEEEECLMLGPGERWICFRLKEKHGTKYMLKNYMYSTLNALMHQTAYAVIHHNEIVGLLRIGNGEELKSSSVIESFHEILHRMEYISGLSNEFTDIQEINSYLLQANYTAEKFEQLSGERHVFFFGDCALQYLLFSCTVQVSAKSLYSKGFWALQEHDKNKNTNYIETLNAYLKNERSITKTAQELFIHRSSLLKRLDKIERLLGDNLDDANIRLYYLICFGLMENELDTTD